MTTVKIETQQVGQAFGCRAVILEARTGRSLAVTMIRPHGCEAVAIADAEALAAYRGWTVDRRPCPVCNGAGTISTYFGHEHTCRACLEATADGGEAMFKKGDRVMTVYRGESCFGTVVMAKKNGVYVVDLEHSDPDIGWVELFPADLVRA